MKITKHNLIEKNIKSITTIYMFLIIRKSKLLEIYICYIDT